MLDGQRPPIRPPQEALHDRVRRALHERLAQEFRPPDSLPADRREDEARLFLLRCYESLGARLPLHHRDQVIAEVIRDALHYGPITDLLQDDTVSEIMVNGPDAVYVERDGAVELTPVRFRDDAHIRMIVDRILGPLGRRLDESSPIVDARMPDGSRLHAVIAPVSRQGTILTIRRFRSASITIDDLIRWEALTPGMAELLRQCVRARCALLVSGATGSGKTSLLNVLARWIDPAERVVTIEDTAELRIPVPNCVALEARPPNVEGRGEITQRDLVRASLRLRPDRVIVGETRGPEAWELVKALNTGHAGGMSTIHANSAREALPKLAQYVIEAGLGMPYEAVLRSIVTAFDAVVHLERAAGGRRHVAAIAEIIAVHEGEILTNEVVTYRPGEPPRWRESRRLRELIAERGGAFPAGVP